MKKIVIKTIKHKKQRYQTVGDYFNKGRKQLINVSSLGNKDYEFLIALHELIEWYLTESRGIQEATITKFDMDFEYRRILGKVGKFDEPGDAIDSPYIKEHQFATWIEKLMAEQLNVNWKDYEITCNSV